MSCKLSPYAQGRLARRNGIAQWQSPFKYGTQAAAWQAGWLDERNAPQGNAEAVRTATEATHSMVDKSTFVPNAYEQGKQARRLQREQSDNPFTDTVLALDWTRGWLIQDAQEIVKMEDLKARSEAWRADAAKEDERNERIATILRDHGITDDEIRGYVDSLPED